jgi:hypothetical protein
MNKIAVAVAVAAAAIAALAYSGAFYQTGAQYYKTCAGHIGERCTGAACPTKVDDDLAKVCSLKLADVMDKIGFALGDTDPGPEHQPCPEQRALAKICPDTYRDVPLIPQMFFDVGLRAIEQAGGLQLEDYFTPANWMFARALKARWPKCADRHA